MPNQSGKVVLVLVLLLLTLGSALYFFSPIVKKENPHSDSIMQEETVVEIPQSNNKSYSSEDLKISFEHPINWIAQEKYYYIMLTSYPASLNSNQEPREDQIEIDIHNYNGGCHETIDENLKDPACGEGGPKVKPNEIVSKEAEDINGAKFYKYVVKTPGGQQKKFYFLEKGDRVLQIDKNPDPSQFKKEFEELVKSIKFL